MYTRKNRQAFFAPHIVEWRSRRTRFDNASLSIKLITTSKLDPVNIKGIVGGKVSEKETDVKRLKQLLEEETKKADAEKENVTSERQNVIKLNEALEAQNDRVNEACTCNHADVIDDSESNKSILLQFKDIAMKMGEISQKNKLMLITCKSNWKRRQSS